MPCRALIDLDAEVTRIHAFPLGLDVQPFQDVNTDGSAGIDIQTMEELKAFFVRLTEEDVFSVRDGKPAAGLREE